MDAIQRKAPDLHWYGAAVLGLIGAGILRLTFGEHWLLRFSWVLITLLLALAMLFLPEGVARPLRVGSRAFAILGLSLLAFLLMLVPGAIAAFFAKAVVEMFPRWLQMVVLLGWVTLMAGVSALFYSRQLRAQVRAWLAEEHPKLLALVQIQSVSILGVLALYVNFVAIAMACFGGLAFMLHDPASPLFLPAARPEVNQGSLADFLLWHVLDAIPIIKVPETIKWAAPLTYERAGAGWLLLLFKVMVIVPVLSGIGHYIKEEGMPDKGMPDSHHAEERAPA
jgi:hypothetical protein